MRGTIHLGGWYTPSPSHATIPFHLHPSQTQSHLGPKLNAHRLEVMGGEGVRGKLGATHQKERQGRSSREAAVCTAVRAQLLLFQLFHLSLNIPARSTRSAKPQQLPTGKFWPVPPPASAQSLALPLSQARMGKGRKRNEKNHKQMFRCGISPRQTSILET